MRVLRYTLQCDAAAQRAGGKRVEQGEKANAWDRGLRRFASSGPGSWLFSRTLIHLDRWTFRATRGKHMCSSLLSELPVAMVTTTGARSGTPRTVPLLAMRTPDGVAKIGSFATCR